MQLDELLDFLTDLNIDNDEFNIQMEPSYSTSKLQELEKKYSICTKNVINKDLSQQSLFELVGLTDSDYELWLTSYENFIYFEGDTYSINRVPLSASIESYFNEPDKEQIKNEYVKKEDDFSSSFFTYNVIYL